MPNIMNFNIVVTGDIIVDRHIMKGNRMKASSRNTDTQILEKIGGAGLTFELLNRTLTVYYETVKETLDNQILYLEFSSRFELSYSEFFFGKEDNLRSLQICNYSSY